MSRVLVIGNGLIGSAIVHELESCGFEVTVFSRKKSPELPCRQLIGDVQSLEDVKKALQLNPEIVVQTSWITTPGEYQYSPLNVGYADATIQLARFSANMSVKHFIVLGSCAEYGLQTIPSRAGFTELFPQNVYAKEKIRTYMECAALLQDTNVRFTWARLFLPFGPNQDTRRIIPSIIESFLQSKPLLIKDCRSLNDWITTRDVASAISWVIQNQLPQEIDIGTSVGYTNYQIADVVSQVLGLKSIDTIIRCAEIEDAFVNVVHDTSSIFTSGWKPKDSLIDGIEWILNK